MSGDRYLAILAPDGGAGETRQLAARAAAHLVLREVFATAKLAVLADAGTRTRSLGSFGVAIGRLVGPPGADAQALGASAARSGGRELVEHCWGDYVALLVPGDDACVLAVRAPGAALPAFRAKKGAVTLIASDVEMLLALDDGPVSIDWTFVAQHLAFPHLRGRRTGLADVDELFSGDATFFYPGRTDRLAIWTPWRFAERDRQITDPGEARTTLHATIREVVKALAPANGSILLELSGGLDSSILAAALSDCPAATSALNLVTPGPEGDERHYARATAQRTGLPLEEQFVPADVDLTTPVDRRTARPGIPAILRMADRQFMHAGKARDIDLFFSGTGGDCVFASPASAAPAADALQEFGPGRRFARAVRDIARIHRASLWDAGRMAWRQAHRPPLHAIWPTDTTFLALEAMPSEPEFHPWLVEPADAPPGRRSHIRAIIAALAHLDGYARHAVAPSIFPLLSQPVLETCLRIPTWMWIEGGRDRAVARAAFKDALPREVLERRTKGGMDAYCLRNYERNRARLVPYLLEGRLAASGLLRLDELEAFLAKPVGRRDDRFYRLLPIVDTEAWLRGWLGDPVIA